jgi:RimJ/RimL family protein N-acetyltransferase
MADDQTPAQRRALPPTPVLETARLILRPLRQEDAIAIQKRVSKWDVVKYLETAPWPYPDDGAETFLRDIALPAVAAGKEMNWALTLKGSTTPDEAVGLLSFSPEGRATGNRGFWLDLDLHGQGLMTEAVVAFQDYVFDVLGHDKLQMSNAQSNAASRRVKQKTGARFVRLEEASFAHGETVSEWWEISKADWDRFRDSD